MISLQFVPLAYRTHGKGPDREKSYALEQVASFLQETAVQGRKAQREEQKNSILHDDKPEPDSLRQRKAPPEDSLNESEVLVEKN